MSTVRPQGGGSERAGRLYIFLGPEGGCFRQKVLKGVVKIPFLCVFLLQCFRGGCLTFGLGGGESLPLKALGGSDYPLLLPMPTYGIDLMEKTTTLLIPITDSSMAFYVNINYFNLENLFSNFYSVC